MESKKLGERLLNADPRRILKRGYAIPTLAKDGSPVKSVNQVTKNDLLNIKLHDGDIISTIEEIKNE